MSTSVSHSPSEATAHLDGPRRFPKIAKVIAENIPDILKNEKRWLVWKAGPLKDSGKFDKVPMDPRSGRNANGNDSKNWMTFQDAIATHERGIGDGIGIALNDP